MRLSRVSLAHAMMALLVTSLDGSTTSGHEVRNSSITQMLKWFTKNGGILHANLEYRVQSNVRRGGMFAIGNISKGSTLCLVPARLFYDPLNRSTTARLPTREKVLSDVSVYGSTCSHLTTASCPTLFCLQRSEVTQVVLRVNERRRC